MPGGGQDSTTRYRPAAILTVALFAVWGGAHRIFGIVLPQFSRFFAVDGLQSAIVYLSMNFSYLLVAIPVALFLRRFGYKPGLVLGLGAFVLGALLLYPAVSQHTYAYFSAAVVVTGIGWAFLEIAANALIVRMGPMATATLRLNLAQSFYPLGLILAAIWGRALILPPQEIAYGAFVEAVVRPYILLGLFVLLIAVMIEYAEFPPVASERTPRTIRLKDDVAALWSRPMFRAGTITLAASTMGLVCLWGSTTAFARHIIHTQPANGWIVFSMATWIMCAAGRFVGTALMRWVAPLRLLAGFAALAIALTAIPACFDSTLALDGMIGASFFMSIMFPTIFAETVVDLGEHTKLGAGILIAASGLGGFAGSMAQGIGTAVIPGFVHAALGIAVICFAAVMAFALTGRRLRAAAPSQVTAMPTPNA